MAEAGHAYSGCSLLVRDPGGVTVMREEWVASGARLDPVGSLQKLPCSFARSSPDGSALALVSPADVALLDSATGAERCRFAAPGVAAVAFSPQGSFLLTFQKPDGQSRNLVLRDARDGAPLWQQIQKAFSKADWPPLLFTPDEALAYRTVTGEVQFFDVAQALAKGAGPTGRLKVPGLASAALSLSPPSHVAAFFPSLKGAPASVRVYRTEGLLANNTTGPTSAPLSEPAAVARRSFFKASTVRMLWGEGAKGVLVWTHSDVDKTNQSYYGDSALHYLATDGSFEGSVPLGKEGPIHDVQWAPSGKEFVVVHGYMPAKTMLFDSKCKPLFDFGSGPRNIVRWSPHGRFILLAGFGNLPGDVDFWDRQSLKVIGSTRAACGVTAEWAPHGRTVAIATTAPRLQVDNGVKIFKYNGALLLHLPFPMLYEAEWLPAPKDKFPDRPPSPSSATSSVAGAKGAGSPGSSPASAPKPAAPYRPPGASASSSATFRARMSGEQDKPKHLGAAAAAAAPEPSKMSKSAQKNLKKKQNRAAASAAGATAAAGSDKVDGLNGDAGGSTEESEPAKQPADSGLASEMAALSVEGDSGEGAGESAADRDKKIRNLTKKLRQIEDLKKKDRAQLTPEQLQKLTQESSVRAELAALQG